MYRENRELLDVKTFYDKVGFITNISPVHLTKHKLAERVACLQEELDEFVQAIEKQDLAAQADALVDLVYFALGTAAMLGLPWQALWDDVQRANLLKERGVTKRGQAVDVIKPPGWVGPRTQEILEAHGYKHAVWSDRFGIVLEALCFDDTVEHGL